jgi:hypothetical protein
MTGMAPPPIDALALIVALGALAGGAPAPRRFALLATAGMAGGAGFALSGVELPWWTGPVWALGLGVIVYAGVPLAARAGMPVVVAAGLIGGMVLGPRELADAGLAVAGSALMLGLTALLTARASRRSGVWACQTARLIGGLAALAGAATLILGDAGSGVGS